MKAKRLVFGITCFLLILLLASCTGGNVTTGAKESAAPQSTADPHASAPEEVSPFAEILRDCTEIEQHVLGSGEVLIMKDAALLSEFFAMLEGCTYTACEKIDSNTPYEIVDIAGYSFYFGTDGGYLYKRQDPTMPSERFLITGFDTVLFQRVLDAFPESVLMHPFETKAYPESVELSDMFRAIKPMVPADDPDAIRAYIDMLHACRFERIEHTKTEDEILNYQFFWYHADFRDGSVHRCYYMDIENAVLYLLYDHDSYHAYRLEGFDRAPVDALLATVDGP